MARRGAVALRVTEISAPASPLSPTADPPSWPRRSPSRPLGLTLRAPLPGHFRCRLSGAPAVVALDEHVEVPRCPIQVSGQIPTTETKCGTAVHTLSFGAFRQGNGLLKLG